MADEAEELGIEQGLLGAILGASVDDDAARIMGVYEKAGVRPEWFTSFETKHLWECIADEWKKHRTVDAFGLAQRYGKDGAKVVADMVANPAEPIHAEYYAEKMREREIYKRLFKACRDTLQETKPETAAQKTEELAAKIEVPAENLAATVRRYNEIAASGDDVDFGKRARLLTSIEKAPFYALKWGPQLLDVFGGAQINTSLQVLGPDSKVIPGLYATGNTAGGMYAVDYPLLLNGNSYGRALAYAMQLGDVLAKPE